MPPLIPRPFRAARVSAASALALVAICLVSCAETAPFITSNAPPVTAPPSAPAPAPPAAAALAPFAQAIDGTPVRLEMIPVSGDAATGLPAGPLWISRTEIPWDLYDLFVFGLDEPDGVAGQAGADAVTRPSKPYIAMDRGFGHAGYPAISMSYRGAESFCRWLSAKTGRAYRLPTESEWRAICARASEGGPRLDDRAWHAGNSKRKTHPVGSKAPDALGLVDLLGNASEWCSGDDGEPVTLGGTYLTPPAELSCAWAVKPTADWNASDPQFPKSVWWLADAGFVGFRVVCVPAKP